jgi:DNA-binding transcriptional ArsR family regulator
MSKLLNARLRRAAPVFSALGDDIRLHIVARLCEGEPLSITRLTEGVPITRQAVTKHLHVLEKARLIKGSRAGRERTWELKPEPLEEARRCLDTISTQWGSALNRLKAFIEEDNS